MAELARSLAIGSITLLVAACGSNADVHPTPAVATDAAADAADAGPFALPCRDSLADVYVAPSSLPAADAPDRLGTVVRCAWDQHLSAGDVEAEGVALRFDVRKPKTGVKVYRIAYLTNRATMQPAISAALVMVPDEPPPSPRPLVVIGHNTRGASPQCAQSKSTTFTELPVLAFSIAASGSTVVFPDLAGGDHGQAPASYLDAKDEAYSMLDATRAMQRLLPKGTTTDGVLAVGLSQGGHVVLSMQALAKSYGLAGRLLGVAAFGQSWAPKKLMAAAISRFSALTTTTAAAALAYATEYFWTHAELYDGPGAGAALFRPEKRALLEAVLRRKCHVGLTSTMPFVGARAFDFFDPAFTDSIGECALSDVGCDVEPAKTWRARFRADRPAVDPDVPIALVGGAKDTTVTPEMFACAIDKIEQDFAASGKAGSLTVCGDANGNHETIVSHYAEWLLQWLEARTNGAPAPSCPGREALGDVKCSAATLPPGD